MDSVKYEYIVFYAVVYFFFNSFLLPHGLLYTTLLTPVMIYYLFKIGKLRKLAFWGLLFLIPIPFQLATGVELKGYAISTIMILSVLTLLLTSYCIVSENEDTFEKVFKKVFIINSVFVAVAILIFPISPIRGLLWYDEILTKGLELIPRLKLFTYEASYYSLIIMPVFLYFILRVLMGLEKHSMLISLSIIASLLLSLSFGVIGALMIAFLVGVIVYWKRASVFLRRFVVLGSISFLIIIVLILIIWPQNPIYFRVDNIFRGEDTSAMGRLIYSFMFAKDIILMYDPIFGIGPGQIKIIAHDMIVNHYEYHGDLAEIVRIPNSMAEVLAIYGIYGFAIKLFVEVYFFFRFKIARNLYSLILFLFIFLYQFTGSFISNAAEIVTWAFVFGLRFSEFEFSYENKSELE